MKTENQISITWHVEDVTNVRSDLTTDQVRDVLHNIKNNHDASIGVNWDVLDCVAELLFPKAATACLFDQGRG